MGFEPTEPIAESSGFRDRRLNPLVPTVRKRVRDSNPRGGEPSDFPSQRHRPLGEPSEDGAGFEPAEALTPLRASNAVP